MALDRTPAFGARDTNTETNMTTTETTATDTWSDELAALKTRYPHVREPILAALNLLLTDPNITVSVRRRHERSMDRARVIAKLAACASAT